MLVVTLIGQRAGQVIDLPVPEARAMLADGRARPWASDSPADHERAGQPATTLEARVGARLDRSLPATRQRRRR